MSDRHSDRRYIFEVELFEVGANQFVCEVKLLFEVGANQFAMRWKHSRGDSWAYRRNRFYFEEIT